MSILPRLRDIILNSYQLVIRNKGKKNKVVIYMDMYFSQTTTVNSECLGKLPSLRTLILIKHVFIFYYEIKFTIYMMVINNS